MSFSLEYENMMVLDTLQASLGLISEDMRGISVQLQPEKVVLLTLEIQVQRLSKNNLFRSRRNINKRRTGYIYNLSPF
jgi:hypothetical protein